MAAIGAITLDGRGTEERFRSAVALHLTGPSAATALERLDGWVVEVKKGDGFVVARTSESLGRTDVLREGYERAERLLDILSFELKGTSEIGAPGRSHIALFRDEDKRVLERVGTQDHPMSMQLQITQTGPDGRPIPAPAPPPAKWVPALRFYRLSQASRSPHEAYRNLWLGLETLLSVAVPLREKEKEGVWLRRAFGQLAQRIPLARDLPGAGDVVDYLMEQHYVRMRCNLFHAKVTHAHLASQMPSAQHTLDAYAQLVLAWRIIASHVGELRPTGSGVITYAGYAALMANLFSRVRFAATEDPAQPDASDTAVSPGGHDVVAFDSSAHIGVDTPGRVENRGIINVASRATLTPFRRIGTSIEDTLYSLDYLPGGLDVNGVDRFEYRQMWRLMNAGVPRAHFD